jgi:hypothetical protein
MERAFVVECESFVDKMFLAQLHRVMSMKRYSVMVRFIDMGLNVVIFTDAKVMKNCVKDERKSTINVNSMKLTLCLATRSEKTFSR